MKSKTMTRACALLLLAGSLCGTAQAQSPAQADGMHAFSQCIVGAANPDDRSKLVRWLFSALATHPDLRALASIDAAQREQFDREMAGLMTRLVTEDCGTELRALELGQLQSAFEIAFRTLGEQAGLAAMSHPDVLVANQALLRYLDLSAFQRVFLEKSGAQ